MHTAQVSTLGDVSFTLPYTPTVKSLAIAQILTQIRFLHRWADFLGGRVASAHLATSSRAAILIRATRDPRARVALL